MYVSRYIASNDLIDNEINAVRANLFATLPVKAPADTGWLRSLLEPDTIMINVKTGSERVWPSRKNRPNMVTLHPVPN